MSLILTVLCAIIGIMFVFLKRRYEYWDRKNIKGPTPVYFVGNLWPFVNKEKNLSFLINSFYDQFPDQKCIGLFQGTTPTLLLRDPDMINQVLVKDFSTFVNRGLKISNDPFQRSLFIEDGDNWRILRQRLTPIFTSGKLKLMMPLLNNCVEEFMKYTRTLTGQKDHEIRSLNSKYTLKAITTCAFGLDVDTFFEENSIFRTMGDKIFELNWKAKFVTILNNIIPGIAIKLNLSIGRTNIRNFFFDLVKKIVIEREGKPKKRQDFMDLLIEMKEKGTVTKVKEDGIYELDIDENIITAQAVTFYAAGFETSSSTMAFLFYELACNPEIQERCYQEVKSIFEKYNGVLTFESLSGLEYVTMTFEETLRKYPVGGLLFRQSILDYTFPGTDVKVERGTKIMIPIHGLHHDPKYYSEPEKFIPERFAPDERDNITRGTYLPFGDGPRNCIGLRFAKVSSLMGIAYFLYNFKLETSENTVKKLTFDPLRTTLSSKDGIWLNIVERKYM